MLARPPTRLFLQITTNVAPNTTLGTNLLPAPGANAQIRLLRVYCSRYYTDTGALNAILQETGAGAIVGLMTWSTAELRPDVLDFGEPGSPLGVNRGLDIQHRASIASQTLSFTVLYLVDTLV